MRRVILAPDSFKGTMSSVKICSLMEEEIKKHYPSTEVIKIPVADGGEGTVDCFLEAMGGSKIDVRVQGPLFEELDTYYGLLQDGETAVIEMASAAGLPLVGERKDPSATTTFGVGQIIRHAVQKGARNIILGLGGSATNDGGVGMAAALGYKFFDQENNEFIPVGGTLDKICRIDTAGIMKELSHCQITAMCDVNNPMFGLNGAAYIYGPQKGANKEMVEELDKHLEYLAGLINTQLGIDIGEQPGSGAAGGMGAGVIAFLKASLKSGIDTVLDAVDFDELIDNCDMVFTGEGKIDSQSLMGKVVTGVSRRAKEKSVPVIAVVGDIGDGIEDIYQQGVTAVFSINRVAVPFEEARLRCEKDMSLTMDTIMRVLKNK